ncbi:peptidase [Streptomyces sp. NBC_00510]
MPSRQVPPSAHLHRPLLAAVLVAAAVLVTAPEASVAVAVQPSTTAVAVHDQAVTRAERQAVLDYWTPERIAALTQPSSGNPSKSGPDGAPWTGRSALGRTVGRLFFTDHGEDSSCTATVVESANGSTVVTAGHCVNNTDLIGEDNQWTRNVLFVPGYRDGRAPYGRFTGRLGVVAPTWLENDQQHGEVYGAYDQAFVVLDTDARGRTVQAAVGAAQRIGFDRPGDRRVHQFGYPRAASDPEREGLPEYTGERLAYCTGRAEQVVGTPEYPAAKGLWGTECIMGGGSSGGPRIAGLDPESGLGTVVGDNSEGGRLDASGNACDPWDPAPGCTRHLVGPQFTSAVTGPLYQHAQHSAR